ncbi:MAG TPA: hypothetical protein PLA85_08085 [Micropepsaceae bacterium]|nr:hypothetical protein [Micropepsaceae bacterium]
MEQSAARLWEETAKDAGKKAEGLRITVQVIFWIVVVMVLVQHVVLPAVAILTGNDFSDDARNHRNWQYFNLHLIEAAPLVALAWGLWDAQRYLGIVASGGLFEAASMKMIAGIGDALWIAALWLAVFAPSLTEFVQGTGVFAIALEPATLVLGVLGLTLSAISRTLARVLETASRLRAENEAFV